MRTRFRPPALAATGMILLAACSSAVTAARAVSPAVAMVRTQDTAGWRIVQIVRHCGDDGLLSVAASGRRDAWAVGIPGGCGADVEHWNGTRWQRVVVPRGVGLADPPLTPFPPVTASSGHDAWIFPSIFQLWGGCNCTYDYALRWDGHRWRRSNFPAKLIVGSAAAFGATDVWAFGVVEHGLQSQAPYAVRYDGRSWRQVKVPVEALAVTATSRRNLWAFGPSLKTAGRSPAKQTLIAARWTGRSWDRIPVPKIPGRTVVEDVFSPSFVATTGPRDLWLAYPVTDRAGNTHVVMMRWRRDSWHRIPVPAPIAATHGMTSDGHGGIWLLADVNINFNTQQYWYHYTAGHWSRQLVPSPKGYGNTLFAMAWVPGTTSVWAVGEADPNYRGHTIGVIARYNP